MAQEFEGKIWLHKRMCDERIGDIDNRFKDFEKTFNELFKRIEKLIEKYETQPPDTSKGFEDPPEDLQLIKKPLGKLKSLIPQRWWSGRLRDLLDKILENLSPKDPEEFRRLRAYIREVYEPALREMLGHWRMEMRMEAFEDCAHRILEDLIYWKIEEAEKK